MRKKKFKAYCVMAPSGAFYQGGSYGGRFGEWPKIYMVSANAEKARMGLEADMQRLSWLPPGLTPFDMGRLFVKEVEVRV